MAMFAKRKKYRSEVTILYKGRRLVSKIDYDGKTELWVDGKKMEVFTDMWHTPVLDIAQEHVDRLESLCF